MAEVDAEQVAGELADPWPARVRTVDHRPAAADERARLAALVLPR